MIVKNKVSKVFKVFKVFKVLRVFKDFIKITIRYARGCARTLLRNGD